MSDDEQDAMRWLHKCSLQEGIPEARTLIAFINAELNEAKRIKADQLAALKAVRIYVQDCIENGHDRTMLANMYGARDEIDAAITKAQVRS